MKPLSMTDDYYRHIFEQSKDGILVADIATMKFVDANASVCELFGYTKKEMLSLAVMDIHPEADLKHVIDVFERQARGEFQIAPDLPCLRKDGSVFHAEINTRAISFDGKMLNVGMFRDVTSRRQSDADISEANRRFDRLLKSITDLTWAADIEGNMLYISDSVEKVYGRPGQEFFDDPDLWSSVVYPEDRSIVAESHERLFSEGSSESVYRIIHTDGSVRWLNDRKSLIRDESSQLTGMGGIATDITKQREYEARIEEQRLNLQNLYDNVSDGIWVLDAESFEIIDVNRSAAEMLGYSHEELLATTIDQTSPFFTKEMAQNRVRLIRKEGQLFFGDQQLRKDGVLIPVQVRVNMSVYNGKEVIIRSCRDMTEAKARENALDEARKRAEAANHAKSAFLANMSHELRTPLNGVLGMAQLLAMSDVNQEQLEYLNYIKQSGDALVNLLDEILDISRIEAGKIELRSEPVQVRDLIDEVRRLFVAQISEKNLKVSIDIDDDVPVVLMGDGLRMKQIMTNIVGNATKFTENGSITIGASGKSVADKFELQLIVKDTGIGIPADFQKSVFDAFTRGDAASNRIYKGTGLGLSIVDHLVRLMNGSIDLHSEEGKGTTVMVTLPLDVTDEDPGLAVTESVPGSNRLLPIRALVVDDNRISLTVAARLTERFVQNVDEAMDGATAIRLFKDNSYDVIFMDIEMPGMDGIKTTQNIRELPDGDDVIVVALTAYATSGDRERVLASGLNGYIAKPVKIQDLKTMLDKYFPEP